MTLMRREIYAPSASSSPTPISGGAWASALASPGAPAPRSVRAGRGRRVLQGLPPILRCRLTDEDGPLPCGALVFRREALAHLLEVHRRAVPVEQLAEYFTPTEDAA